MATGSTDKFQSQRWLKSLQVRAMHKLINIRNSARDLSVKYAYVASLTVAVLAVGL